MTIQPKKPTVAKSVQMRAVYKNDKNYVCGMCKKEHRDRLSAKNCLLQCIQDLVMAQPLKLVKHHAKTGYQCQICKREYETIEKSFSCVKECLETMDRQLTYERKMSGVKAVTNRQVTLNMPTNIEPIVRLASPFKRKPKEDDLMNEPEVGDLSAKKAKG